MRTLYSLAGKTAAKQVSGSIRW